MGWINPNGIPWNNSADLANIVKDMIYCVAWSINAADVLFEGVTLMIRVKLSTRRLMTVVAASALAFSGVQSDHQPGWHLGIGHGLRYGVCRNDGFGRSAGSHGKLLGWTYQAGVWDRDEPRESNGTVRHGLWVRTGGPIWRWVACVVILDVRWTIW
jgi:hypothetical protein